MTYELQITTNTYLDTRVRKRVTVNGAEFDEAFIAELLAKHFSANAERQRPTISTAFEIYMRENPSSHRRKFAYNATRYYQYFYDLFGDIALEDLRHHHCHRYSSLHKKAHAR